MEEERLMDKREMDACNKKHGEKKKDCKKPSFLSLTGFSEISPVSLPALGMLELAETGEFFETFDSLKCRALRVCVHGVCEVRHACSFIITVLS